MTPSKNDLYKFSDSHGTFHVANADQHGGLYFPLVNEQGFMSSITPDLGGDIKLDQHSFLTLPVAFEDLHLSRAARNFWLSFGKKGTLWSVAGRSVWQRAQPEADQTTLEAGFLWQRLKRSNKKLGVEAHVLNFVPSGSAHYEVMSVTIKNISKKPLSFTATSAIPLYGRSADNLRDHRHVTSLLHRLTKEAFGVSLCPTMTFNERGHLINTSTYYVVGCDDKGRPPVGFFPTVDSFIGAGGDLEKPMALTLGQKPFKQISETDQGKEAMGALQFESVTLKPGASATFTLLLGIDKDSGELPTPPRAAEVNQMLETTEKFWEKKLSTIQFETGNNSFNAWVRWVQLQPTLRKLFGNSFLPDFDYGRGGRGWRDLWQDCLALLLQNPEEVRGDIVHNFGGVRLDGSNATIIGRKKIDDKWMPEFIADRNNISRTWMDHGIWPFLTTLLYVNQTGDWDVLREQVTYFRDALTHRAKKVDAAWGEKKDAPRPTGTVLEHILIQTVVQFFNVGEHNMIRLEDADWNDGLDMAHRRGESVAFTNLYGGNLEAIAALLDTLGAKAAWKELELAEEVVKLLGLHLTDNNFDNIVEKRERLRAYFDAVAKGISGIKVAVPLEKLAADLRAKAAWIKARVNEQEWIKENGHGWYNGYYDDNGKRVEGKMGTRVRVTLSGQVYALMAGVSDEERTPALIKAVDTYLFDKKLGGVRLNSDFGGIQPQLGRAFSFAFGEKENGAVFSHMAVMYAYALYQRGFASEGHRVLGSLFQMAIKSERSRIFPGLPEYFNNEGRGRYMYLTGSASWYVLTLLTQAFGVRGKDGDLLIAPKLEPDQFDSKGRAVVSLQFAGSRVNVTIINARRQPCEKLKIKEVTADGNKVAFERISDREVVIKRALVSKQKSWNLEVTLGL